MAITISICNQKGGVGKTATAQNLSAVLAQMGKKVLAIDLDPQQDLSKNNGLKEVRPSIKDFLQEEDKLPFQKIDDNLSIITGYKDLLDLLGKELKINTLKNKFKVYQNDFDYIIIDCQPQNIASKTLTINECALVATDYLLIPTNASSNGISGAFDFLGTIQNIRKTSNRSLKVLGILLNITEERQVITKEAKELLSKNPELSFKSFIRKDIRLKTSEMENKSVIKLYPQSRVSRDYKRMTDEVLTKIKNFEHER